MPFDLLTPGDWLRPPLCPTIDEFSSQVNVDPELDVDTYLDDSDSDIEDADSETKEDDKIGKTDGFDYLESNSLAQHVDEHFIPNQNEYTIYVCMFRTQRVLGPMFVQYALQLSTQPNTINAPSTKYSALRHPDWVPDTEGQDDVSDADQRQTAFINTCAAVVADTFPRAAMKMSYTQRFRGYVMHPDLATNCAYAFFDCTFDRISDALPARFQWSVITDILNADDGNIDSGLTKIFKSVPELAGPEIKPTLLYFCRTPMVVGASNNMVVPHVYDPNIGRAHCFTRRKAANSRRAAAFDPNIVSVGTNGERALIKSADNFVEI